MAFTPNNGEPNRKQTGTWNGQVGLGGGFLGVWDVLYMVGCKPTVTV